VSIAKRAGRMSLAVGISRILGLVREQVFAFLFGAGFYSDAFLLAFRIPNLFRDLFAEGAFSTAFISVFAKQAEKEKQKTLARDISLVLSICVLTLSLVLYFTAPAVVELLASEFKSSEGKFELTVGLTRFLLPFLFFASLAALCMGILNTMGSYFIPAMGAAAFNVASVVIGGGLGFYFLKSNDTSSIWGFAVGSIVGGFLQWAVQWGRMREYGFTPALGLLNLFRPKRWKLAFENPAVKRVFIIMGPSVIAVAAMQINVMVNTFFAAGLEEGSVSWLVYAYRLVHFPMGIFGVAISMASLPELSRLVSQPLQFGNTLKRALRMATILTIGSTAGLIFLGEPIVALIFERGRFIVEDTIQTNDALTFYSIGLIAFALNKILLMAFYAMENIWIPSMISAFSIVTNLVFAYYFSTTMGHEGLALSVSLSSILNVFMLLGFLLRKKINVFDLRWLKIILASMVAIIPMWLAVQLDLVGIVLRHRFDGVFVFAPLLLLLIAVLGAAYVSTVALFTQEGRDFAKRIASRFGFKR